MERLKISGKNKPVSVQCNTLQLYTIAKVYFNGLLVGTTTVLGNYSHKFICAN